MNIAIYSIIFLVALVLLSYVGQLVRRKNGDGKLPQEQQAPQLAETLPLPANEQGNAHEEDDDDEYVEEGDFEIRVKTFPFKPMTPEEAILQMNLIGHAFYAFTDSESGEVCVVYKRKAGSYGLIVPEK